MKCGRKQASDNDSLHHSCSKHCCKCYDISQLFSAHTKRTTSHLMQSLDNVETQFSKEQPSQSCEYATSSSSIRTRIKWTMDLHHKFEECVNHLGGPMKATQKGILKLMRTHELTIDHVKSHLQKYRSLKQVQDSMQETRLKEKETNPKGSRINELMRLQHQVGQHLGKQLEVQRELCLLVEEQNKQLQVLHEMIKYQKGKNS